MDPQNLPGSLKAAILIQSLDKKISQEILNGLTENERELIKSHLSQMGPVSEDLVEMVAGEFTLMAAKGRPGLKSHFGEKEGKQALAGSKSQAAGLKALQSLDPDQLVALIKDEHPQTIAIILVHIKSELASETLAKLPDEIKADVALRIASLDKVISGMVEEVEKVFEGVLKSKQSSGTHKTGGVDHLAELVKQLPGSSGELILSEIEETNPELAEEIRKRLFVFEDLVLVDDRSLQKILRSVETKELATALKGASEYVREKVLRNLSQRAAEMLAEEIEYLGAVRMKDVEDAQQIIIKIIQDLEAKGEIVVGGHGKEEFIE
jgi:flagellar motor switch protein FliG